MNAQIQISNRYKPVGWVCLVLGLALGSASIFGEFEPDYLDFRVPSFFASSYPWESDQRQKEFQIVEMTSNNWSDEIGGVLVLLGCLVLMLAREKEEDELIQKIRLESLLWAVLLNGILMILALLMFYDINYFYVLISSVVLFYLLFIVRFHIVLYQFKSANHEE